MSTDLTSASVVRPLDPSIATDVARACARVAPTWPLDRFIAVNPLWGMIDRPLSEVAAELRSLNGARLAMPRRWFRDARREGRLADAHLLDALAQERSPLTLAELLAELERDEVEAPRRARVADVVDARRDLVREESWRAFITHSVSQRCASFFDDTQAAHAPDPSGGLYASWRRAAVGDRSPALRMGLDAYRRVMRDAPATASAMIERALVDLDVAPVERERYMASLLLDLNGWASWCAYRRHSARLAGGDDDTLVDLLAILMAWEWALLRSTDRGVAQRWQLAMAAWPEVDATARRAQPVAWVLQRAMELAYQSDLRRALPAGFAFEATQGPDVQAVFCIDVRSEALRRALEAESGAVQTLGFAGFFGLPIEYAPRGAAAARPQLPGLLSPRLRATDEGLARRAEAMRAARIDDLRGWDALKTGALSTFAFVEAAGLGYARELLVDSLGWRRSTRADEVGLAPDDRARRKVRLTTRADGSALDDDARADLAAGMLRAMSLTQNFARLVLLAGHGSQTRNNPLAASLACGACCGQSGEVNARAAAALLNDPAVRAGLGRRGVRVPDTTRFLAALHDTTTDDVTLFDLDEVPASHAREVATLRAWLEGASARARETRARRLGVRDTGPRLHDAMRGRASDWAEVRPEWGLADNAAFIAAPRERTRRLDLAGRSFLHEYRWRDDAGFATLELIMTAPMIVAHWINLQYYASTVDNGRFGSGDKTLHNVVGGHLGVFEGNGGDLRIGLPMQSLHDGARWMHTPLRLSVFIEAPREAIEAVMQKHATVRALVEHRWLDLFQLDEASLAVHRINGSTHGPPWPQVTQPR